MGLDDALADGQAQAGPSAVGPRVALAAVDLRELAEEKGQAFGRDAFALVGDRDGNMEFLLEDGDGDAEVCLEYLAALASRLLKT